MAELFRMVGRPVEYGDVRISSEDAELFRQTALEGVKIKKLHIDDESSLVMTTAYASSMLANAWSDYELAETALYTKSIAAKDPDRWQSNMTFAHFRDSQRDTKIYNSFTVESVEGELMSAVRRVRVIRHIGGFAINDGEIIEDLVREERKCFEEPMTPEHIDAIQQRTHQVVGRAQVLAMRISGRPRF